jgi:membrane protease YdiL (CAAX protease family)
MMNHFGRDSASPDPPSAGSVHPPLARPVTEGPLPTFAVVEAMGIDALSRGQAAGNLVVLATVAVVYFMAWTLLSACLADGAAWLSRPPVKLGATLLIGSLLAVLALLRLHGAGLDPASVGFTRRSLGADFLLGLPATVGTFVVLYLSGLVIWVVWPAGTAQMNSNAERIREMLPPLSVPLIVVVSVVVGFYEEIIFRGVLLTHLRRITGSWTVGIVVNSILFAALHGHTQEPVTIIRLVPIALMWSLLTLWRRSLIPAITAHTLFDFLQLLYLLYTSDGA